MLRQQAVGHIRDGIDHKRRLPGIIAGEGLLADHIIRLDFNHASKGGQRVHNLIRVVAVHMRAQQAVGFRYHLGVAQTKQHFMHFCLQGRCAGFFQQHLGAVAVGQHLIAVNLAYLLRDINDSAVLRWHRCAAYDGIHKAFHKVQKCHRARVRHLQRFLLGQGVFGAVHCDTQG